MCLSHMITSCSSCRFLYGDQARFFSDEIHPTLKHSKTGTVAMATAGENLNASQVYNKFANRMISKCFIALVEACYLSRTVLRCVWFEILPGG